MKNVRTPWMVAVAAGTLTSCAFAQVNNPEVETNETKATATVAASGGAGMANGDTISGNTTGTSTTVAGAASADIFRVKTAAGPLGIYRNRLVLSTTGTAGHVGAILGLNQSSSIGILTTDAVLQTSSSTTAPGRMNQWYGFGKQEEIYYRVTGGTATTADYTATLEVTPVTPVVGPTLPPGSIRFNTLGLTTIDTDMWIYDSNFNAIANFGNDDNSIASGGTGTGFQSRFSRDFTAGTYYLAISRFNLANDQVAATDDDFRTAAVLDFPNAVLGTTTTTPTSFNVEIGSQTVPVSYTDSYGVSFISFTVVDAVSGGCPTTAQTVVEGQTANISVIVRPQTGVPVNTVVVDASSINPAATSVVLTDPDNDNIWTGSVQATVLASATPFALPFVITDAIGSANGSCNITVTSTATGACCLTSGCAIISEYNCGLQSGTFNGAGTNCGGLSQGTSTNTFTSIAGTGTDLSATPKTAGSDDDGRWTVTLPFPVNYAGIPATEISVCTNGFIQFGPGPAYSTEFTNVAIPSATDPDNMVAALWDDLTMSAVARIYTQTDGTPGSQTFTVSFENYRQLSATTDNFNFQFVMTEGSDVVEVRYGNMAPAISGTDFTVGAENADGSGGVNVDSALVGSGNVAFTYGPTGNPCEAVGCDDIDFNNDEVFPDDQDVVDFFNVLAGADCPACNDIDFNNNDVFPEDQDVIDFFNVLAGGQCP